ncbi:MAG: NAD(P)-dependent oxidoreductase [Desulfuromonadales bacterium]|nr:NAD(P)-dependent oxidoreductase [Desulfuromonadales bacterium]
MPDLLTTPTAELAVTLLLGLVRKLCTGDAYVRSGDFQGWRPIFYGSGLAGSRIGLLGMGAIGQAIARRLAGFDARLSYYDPVRLSVADEHKIPLRFQPFEALLACSDALICSVPLNLKTAVDCHMLAVTALISAL